MWYKALVVGALTAANVAALACGRLDLAGSLGALTVTALLVMPGGRRY